MTARDECETVVGEPEGGSVSQLAGSQVTGFYANLAAFLSLYSLRDDNARDESRDDPHTILRPTDGEPFDKSDALIPRAGGTASLVNI